VKITPLPTNLVYSASTSRGAINWDKNTTSISCDIALSPASSWLSVIPEVVETVYAGLESTGKRTEWKLEWPLKGAGGGASLSLPTARAQYDVAVELVNDKALVIGKQNVSLSAGYRTGFSTKCGFMLIPPASSAKTVVFKDIDVNKVTENLTVRVATLNGKNADVEARAQGVTILSEGDFSRILCGQEYKTGDTGPAGGIMVVTLTNIFEAAPSDSGTNAWGVRRTESGGTGTAAGMGKRNTRALVSVLEKAGESGKAAQTCSALQQGGKDGWFLPSLDDLLLVYTHLKQNGLGGFSDSLYWSSSEYDGHDGWYIDFTDGKTGHDYKDNTYSVRAIRAF